MTYTERRIDLNTGLPALPEGCIWRITKDHYRDGSFRYFSLKVVKVETKTSTYTSWLGKEKIVTETIEHELTSDIVYDFIGEYSAGFAFALDKGKILKNALRILDEVDAAAEMAKKEEDARKESETLLGDYPPKTLNQ